MSSTTAQHADTATAPATKLRLRGIALIVGAVLIAVLIKGDVLKFYWFPVLTGLTYLVAAGVSGSRSTLWAPGLVVTSFGLGAAMWLRDGRPADSFQLLALGVLAIGLGTVLAGLLNEYAGFAISTMSVGLSVLLLGVFLLLEQQAVSPVAGKPDVYIALLAIWGAYELFRSTKKA
ncbi:MAG: hypothetical protein ABIO67_09165 [Mycobacteriales bacterium]